MGVKNWNDDIIPWKWTDSSEISPGAIAIDVPNYLTRRLAVIPQRHTQRGRLPLAHVGFFLSLVKSTLTAHILPIFVFDGPPEARKRNPNPSLVKSASDLLRRFQHEGDPFNEEIAAELWKSPALRMYFAAEHLRSLGNIVGVPTMTAPSEAEMYSAVLCREGIVETVVSNDADALLFGSPHVTKQLQLSSNRILRVTLKDLENHLSLDLELLRDLAIVSGCDFHKEGVKGIGPRRGSALLQKYGGLQGLLRTKGYSVSERREYTEAREVFDEASFISVKNLEPRFNPPIMPKLIKTLEIVMPSENASTIATKILSLWKNFGNHQSSLEQWL